MIFSFEGIDGCGKTTQVARLVERLEDAGYDVLRVREPGGTDLGEAVRDLLLDTARTIDDMAEMLLFSAARAQLVTERIVPHVRAGGVVVCDRFFDSTVAYQGGGRRVAQVAWLYDFQRRVTAGLVPDRTYLIRIPVDVAAARLSGRTAATGRDRMEHADRAFWVRTSEAYDRLAEKAAERYRVVDGTKQIDAIARTIWADAQELTN